MVTVFGIYRCAGIGMFALLLALCPTVDARAQAAAQGFDSQSAPLADAILKRNESQVLRVLQEGADPNSTVNGAPVLYLAAQESLCKAVAELVRRGAVVDASPKSRPGATALGVAAQGGHLECVHLLLAAGANANASGQSGATPLILAAQYGKVETSELLLDAGAQIDRRRPDGQTALGLAAERGFAKVVSLLLQRGANVANHDAKGSTPLHHAIRKDDIAITRLLVQAMSNIEAQAVNGIRPLHASAYRRNAEITAYLLSAGADPNARMRDNVTPMHVAAGGGAIAVAQALLPVADLAARDSRGDTPLDIARKRNDSRMIDLLSKARKP